MCEENGEPVKGEEAVGFGRPEHALIGNLNWDIPLCGGHVSTQSLPAHVVLASWLCSRLQRRLGRSMATRRAVIHILEVAEGLVSAAQTTPALHTSQPNREC